MGKLVEEVDGHLEYIAEFAWRVGEACCWGRWARGVYVEFAWARGEACCWRESAINYVVAAYDLKTTWSVGAVSA